MSGSNCSCLTCIQVSQEAGQAVWYSHLLKNFPQFVVIHIVKGFSVVNEEEVDVFLELSWFFYNPLGVDNLISGSSVFYNSNLNIWKFLVHVLLRPSLENFEHYFANIAIQLLTFFFQHSTSMSLSSNFKGEKSWFALICARCLPSLISNIYGSQGALPCYDVKWAQLYGSLNILWPLWLEWKLTFPILWPLLSFPNLLAYLVQYFYSIIF